MTETQDARQDIEALKRGPTDIDGNHVAGSREDKGWNDCIDHLAPRLARTVPEGFAIVPLEPTQEQISVGIANLDCSPMSWEERKENLIKAYKAMISAAPQPPVRTVPDDVAWLVENHNDNRIRYLKMTGWGVEWVDDANEAMRLCRRSDAEMMAEGAFDGDAIRIVEHMWPDVPAAPQQPGEK